MKVKTTRICARKGCNKEFKLYRTTDKYCSPACAYEAQNQKPKTKASKKERKPIKQQSYKRKQESYLYTKKRKTFLLQPENKYCPVAKEVFNESRLACEVHHKAGRIGKLLNYVPYWLAVSRKGHLWIHANPEEAYEKGFLIRSTTV